ncbi:XRE family transcriptional regulator [Shewanella sp. Choline-02u-19]|uniref:DeoR/GlpR family DNA-binding transcription regulator n=1 Tax=unclassified Shewanella TaxID=196818 RepID=UPI000C327920|nr:MULTISPECIES: DeoR family transcriptional regulator [unclassified Shewanella]PKG56066.1 XRE family transcriptional regulator [Shewanella sp. GutDb-MelDb]PKG75562.1 XRE family transcriptional regulator [Shewanella sp. GutCb]PKH60005.1 XRE family transcriptional regulator [Shewanella sp. Bg11-22]PKI30686.1 XRE family transcriptional regulator [Shewanella sp. Choline-02u-19]
MNKRNTQQRRHSIISLLNEQGEVSVEELSLRFETSEVTIRKDLGTLEKTGLLLRRYGGAVAVPDEVTQQFSAKIAPNKLSIARVAAELIRDHNRIIIDSGSTTSGLIAQLNAKRGLLVMTNSLTLANAIHDLENEPTLLMTGGTWDPHSESFQGQIAEQVLRSYNFDQLFIGADGIDLERGTTTFNELTGLSKVMAEVSREVIVMLESEKLGRRIPNLELPWSNISVLVSDDKLPTEAVESISKHGVRVILAPYVG